LLSDLGLSKFSREVAAKIQIYLKAMAMAGYAYDGSDESYATFGLG
jgi:hypothetical protein